MTMSPGYFYDAITTLVGRELRIRYKGSLLGVVWAVLSPLGTVLILQILFTQIVPLKIPHYAAFVYAGLLPWTWFQSAVHTGASTLLDNRDLVRRPFFSRPLLPAVVTSTNFMLYLIALPVLLVLLSFEGLRPSPYLLVLPIIWLVLAAFTLACTLLVAALGVLIRDVQHLLDVGLLLWFYLTPVFYDLQQVSPDRARWFALNPMTAPVEAHRAVTLYGQPPDWGALGATAAFSVVLLAVSMVIFRALEDAFVEEV
jgi:ABC-type polysaccharide/polyol phosphate export permease